MNKVILIGNAGNEPDVHTFDDGGAVANISLATTKKGYTLQNGTQVPDRTEWHRVVVKGNTAKVVQNYVHKGDRIGVVGELAYREYEDRNGQKAKVAEIICHELELLSPKKDGSQQPAQQQPVQQQPQPVQQPQQEVYTPQEGDLPF